MSYKDFSGKKYGRLTPLHRDQNNTGRTKWVCRCECGEVKSIPISSLTSGRANSCGCYRKEVTSMRMQKHGRKNKRLYSIWLNMRSRCNNTNAKSFENYGKRGISVCSEWDDYENFYNWSINNGYQKDLTIDRIDNDGNYEPSNCRWVDRFVQMNNTSKNVFIEIEGNIRTLSDHSKHYGIHYEKLYYRYEVGMRGEELIQPTLTRKLLINIDGETKNLKEWSGIYGINYNTLQDRYNKGLRGKELFSPVDKKYSEKAKKRNRESA